MTTSLAIARAASSLRRHCTARDLAAVEAGIVALRTLDADHPDIDLAMALLWEAKGQTVEATAARLRGYERIAASTGDPVAKTFLTSILGWAIDARDGHAVLRRVAPTSSSPQVLEAFLTVACGRGHFEDGAAAIARLRELTGDRDRDAEDTVALGRSIERILSFEADSVVVRPPPIDERATLHHSVVTQAVIGAAERRGRLDADFARPLAEVLEVWGVDTEAAMLRALRHLLALGRDACAEAFLDLTADRLSTAAKTAILDHAIGSAVRRDALEAACGYGRRFESLTGWSGAALARLSSYVGVRARGRPAWAPRLQALAREQAAADAPDEVRAPPFPAQGPAYRPDERIDVFLKCVKRPFDIHPFVSFWLDCFDDPARYRVRLLDDSGLDLAGHYARYPIADSRSLREGTNEARALFAGARRPLNMLRWESVANLTPFAQTESRWFWNIDADDIRPLLDARTTMADLRRRLRDVEDFAADRRLMAISYDLWASAHYLLDHGYHWTFGICLCRSDPALLGRMLASLAGCDVPAFGINLDHFLSRLSDGQLAGGRYSRAFASFIFSRAKVLQKDPLGMEFYHRHDGLKKKLSFDARVAAQIQADLHPKTLVV